MLGDLAGFLKPPQCAPWPTLGTCSKPSCSSTVLTRMKAAVVKKYDKQNSARTKPPQTQPCIWTEQSSHCWHAGRQSSLADFFKSAFPLTVCQGNLGFLFHTPQYSLAYISNPIVIAHTDCSTWIHTCIRDLCFFSASDVIFFTKVFNK